MVQNEQLAPQKVCHTIILVAQKDLPHEVQACVRKPTAHRQGVPQVKPDTLLTSAAPATPAMHAGCVSHWQLQGKGRINDVRHQSKAALC